MNSSPSTSAPTNDHHNTGSAKTNSSSSTPAPTTDHHNISAKTNSSSSTPAPTTAHHNSNSATTDTQKLEADVAQAKEYLLKQEAFRAKTKQPLEKQYPALVDLFKQESEVAVAMTKQHLQKEKAPPTHAPKQHLQKEKTPPTHAPTPN